MPFNAQQTRALRAKLRRRHVRTRLAHGKAMAFVEGWHVIAEANRIFGFEYWDRRTLAPRCIWTKVRRDGQTAVLYTTTVRITVRAGAEVIMRDGIGTGSGVAVDPEIAHDIALKAAETDATKRALATFGNPFGLALYDKEQAGVTGRAQRPKSGVAAGAHEPRASDLTLQALEGARSSHQPLDFVAAATESVMRLHRLEDLYAFWDANRPALRALKGVQPQLADDLIETLKRRARALGNKDRTGRPRISAPTRVPEPPHAAGSDGSVGPQPDALPEETASHAAPTGTSAALAGRSGLPAVTGSVGVAPERREADQSPAHADPGAPVGVISNVPSRATLLPKEKRLRDPAHLAYVRSQACLVCGRQPSHAHHLRFAQPRAFGMKVSDEYTVPLCFLHHDALHQVGDERVWWEARGIDAMEVAAQLWQASRPYASDRSDPDTPAQPHARG